MSSILSEERIDILCEKEKRRTREREKQEEVKKFAFEDCIVVDFCLKNCRTVTHTSGMFSEIECVVKCRLWPIPFVVICSLQ